MSSRPAPRKSSLGVSHPAAPAAGDVESELSAGRPAVVKPAKAPSTRTKVTFYTTTELAGQARAALTYVPAAEHGYRNLSELVADALAEKLRAMQEQHNNGQPWPDTRAGTVATGRPLE